MIRHYLLRDWPTAEENYRPSLRKCSKYFPYRTSSALTEHRRILFHSSLEQVPLLEEITCLTGKESLQMYNFQAFRIVQKHDNNQIAKSISRETDDSLIPNQELKGTSTGRTSLTHISDNSAIQYRRKNGNLVQIIHHGRNSQETKVKDNRSSK